MCSLKYSVNNFCSGDCAHSYVLLHELVALLLILVLYSTSTIDNNTRNNRIRMQLFTFGLNWHVAKLSP